MKEGFGPPFFVHEKRGTWPLLILFVGLSDFHTALSTRLEAETSRKSE